jgi:hypothetical protein
LRICGWQLGRARKAQVLVGNNDEGLGKAGMITSIPPLREGDSNENHDEFNY